MTKLLILAGVIIASLGIYLGFGSKYFQNIQPPKYTGPVEKITVSNIEEFSTLVWIAENQGYFRRY